MYNTDELYGEMLERLKKICKQKNITQYALAKATGMSTSSVSCLMKGETKPYVYTMLAICGALDVSLGDLTGYREPLMDKGSEYLVRAYHIMPPEKRRLLLIYVDMLLQFQDEIRE